MKAALVAAIIAACALAGGARADGDPASDYLLVSRIFFPYDAKIPAAKKRELIQVVSAANQGGYKIRVALISSRFDMGAIPSLWRKPRAYARFLGAELQFLYKQRVLIVMPNGFGFYWRGHDATAAYASLAPIAVDAGAVGLVDAAEAAVRELER